MTSSTPAEALGECVVCGKLCSKGCSSCKKAGLDWMYFCSVDHQRLIWRVHRFVCGKNPFEWPPLTDAEVEEVRELKNDPVSENGQTWSEYNAARLCGRHIRTGAISPSGPFVNEAYFGNFLETLKVQQSEEAQGELGLVRKLRFFVKFNAELKTKEVAPGAALHHVILSDPLGWICRQMDMCRQELPKELGRSSSWKHRVFTFLAIIVATLVYSSEHLVTFDRNQYPFLQYSKSAILSVCDDVLKEDILSETRRTVEAMLSALLQLVEE
ncbi:hypothetical protein JCM5350_005035 [Sporobolomyces pararoseus]